MPFISSGVRPKIVFLFGRPRHCKSAGRVKVEVYTGTMQIISTPERESNGLVNSMRTFREAENHVENSCDMRNLTLTEVQGIMQVNSDTQKYYATVLCAVLDNYVARNDKVQLLV